MADDSPESPERLTAKRRASLRAAPTYLLAQEFITPYTPEQNGIIERFFRSVKEECVCSTTSSASSTPWIHEIC